MSIIDQIDWKKNNGLIPVITQEENTNEVLMLAYMNKQALELTIHTNIAHYFSRTKQRIWEKGESSGNIQNICDILLDCDNDTILLKVKQTGVACHTGEKTCFFKNIKSHKITENTHKHNASTYGIIDDLYHIIENRKNSNY